MRTANAMKAHQDRLLCGIAISMTLASLALAARAESVGLAWKPSPSVGATGYNVYYGVSGVFTNKQDAGNVTSTAIHDLEPGNTYFFYATTYDATGDESGPSETVHYTVNAIPLVSNLSGETLRETPLAVTLLGSDLNGDSLTWTIVAPPAYGTLGGVAPNLIYTPAPGCTGPDAFTYKVNDGTADSLIATVSILVMEPPDLQPPLVAVEAPSEGSTVSGMVAVNVGAFDNVAIAKIDLYLNDHLSGTASSAPAVFTWDTRLQPDGTCKLQAKAFDVAGNSAISAPVTVSVRNVLPDLAAPTVNILSPQAGSKVAGIAQIEVAAQDEGTLTEVQCYVGDTLIGSSAQAPAVFAWNTAAYPDGTHTVKARATDAAANYAEVLRTVSVENNTAPVVVIDSPSGSATVQGTLDIVVRATDDCGVVKLELSVDEGPVVASATTGEATLSFDSTNLENGNHTLHVVAYDDAGKTGSATLEVVVENTPTPADTVAPVVTITAPKTGSVIRKNFSVKVMSSDNVAVTSVTLFLGGKPIATSNSRNPNFTVLAAALPPGEHTFYATASDAAGNVGVSSQVVVRKK